jgi:hypothetical protein
MTLSDFPELHGLLEDLNIMLREQVDVSHHLIALLNTIESLDVEENDSDINRIVDLIDVFEHRTQRPETMFRAIRECVSQIKKGRNELSARQYVLQALDSINYPQPAARIKQFVWANERVELNTRTFGALRRDEKLSWENKPFHRSAYIVPVIDVQGDAQSHWIARSDWPLWRRIVVEGATEIFDLKWLELLFYGSEATLDTEFLDPYVSLIPKYAAEILGMNPPNAHGQSILEFRPNRLEDDRERTYTTDYVRRDFINGWLAEVRSVVVSKLDSSESRIIVSQREAEDDFKEEDRLLNRRNPPSRLWGN